MLPEFADAEAFPEATVLVCFRKQPRGVHEVLAYNCEGNGEQDSV